jgi:hypothetical protein
MDADDALILLVEICERVDRLKEAEQANATELRRLLAEVRLLRVELSSDDVADDAPVLDDAAVYPLEPLEPLEHQPMPLGRLIVKTQPAANGTSGIS